MHFLKTTMVGGFLFLVPVAVAAFIVGKAFDLVRFVVILLEEHVPGIKFVGIDLIVVAALVLLCFLAGLFARSKAGKRLGKKIDAWLLSTIPGYSIVKGVTDSLRASERAVARLRPGRGPVRRQLAARLRSRADTRRDRRDLPARLSRPVVGLGGLHERGTRRPH